MAEHTTLLRMADLQARGVVRSRQQLKNLVADHGFPPGFLLSPNVRVFDEAEVEAWIASRRLTSADVRAA